MVNSLYFRASSPDQTSIPNCTDGWQWSYNSLSQSPCLVAAWLAFPCYQANNTIYTLQYGESYSGPSEPLSQPRQCNTVLYSLVSACAACQGSTWIKWSQWVQNCSGAYGRSNYMLYYILYFCCPYSIMPHSELLRTYYTCDF
ncbi:hypothetical protein BC827DRAFT_207117 [Russula dissimulans]|nr:hypothetical protein BC827DRAFT_207117 [Russula dissimulans]